MSKMNFQILLSFKLFFLKKNKNPHNFDIISYNPSFGSNYD